MKKLSPKIRIQIFLIVAILLWCVVAGVAVISRDQGSSVDPIYPNVHPNTASSLFLPYAGETEPLDGETSVVLLPADAVSQVAATLAVSETGNRIVLLELVDNLGTDLITTEWNWQTAFGVTRLDAAIVGQWTENGVCVDNRRLGGESPLALAASACSYYLPDHSLNVLLADSSCPDAVQQALADIFPLTDTTVLVLMTAATEPADLQSATLAELLRLPGAQWEDACGVAGAAALRSATACLPSSSRNQVTVMAAGNEVPENLSDFIIYWQED